jgi:hypothetical protein
MRWTAAAATALCACAGDLDPPSIVKTPRVLAVVASPPIAPPGEDVEVTAMVVDPEDRPLRLSWTACSRFEALGGNQSLQYSEEAPTEGCVEGAPGVFDLERRGDTGVLRGVLTALVYEDLEALAATYGEGLPPDLLQFVVETSGLPVTIGLTVRTGSYELVRSFKRVLIFTGEPRGTNPPEPRFAVGERWVSARDVEEPFVCEPEDGEPIALDAGSDVVLTPDPDDEAWQEDYRIIDASGAVVDRHEDSYYSWFSTGGSFEEEQTQAPLRDTVWRAPRAAGAYPLWIVVRDGHGGTSACRAQVEVRP